MVIVLMLAAFSLLAEPAYQRILKEPPYVAAFQSDRPCFTQRQIERVAGDLGRYFRRLCHAVGSYERTASGRRLDHVLALEFPVGARDGVRVDGEVDRKLLDRGELLSRLQDAECD